MASNNDYLRIARNERRRMQQRIKRIESFSGKFNGKTKKVISKKIETLQRFMEATKVYDYSGEKRVRRTKDKIESNVDALKSINDGTSLYLGKNGRKNLVTETEINMARRGLPSTYTSREVQIFYRATQDVWQKDTVHPLGRNAAILEAYGFKDLQEAIETVLEKNKKAVEDAENNPENDMTPEQRERYDAEPTEEEDVSYDVEQDVFTALREMRDKYIKSLNRKK